MQRCVTWVLMVSLLVACKPERPDSDQYRVGKRGLVEAEEVEQLKRERLTLLIVGGVSITAAEIASLMTELSPQMRAYFSQPDQAARLLVNYGLVQALAFEGERTGLHNDPAVRLAHENALALAYRQQFLADRVRPADFSEQQVRRYVEEHRDELLDALVRADEMPLERIIDYVDHHRKALIRELIDKHPVSDKEIADHVRRHGPALEKVILRRKTEHIRSSGENSGPKAATPEELAQAAMEELELELELGMSETAIRQLAQDKLRNARKAQISSAQMENAARARLVEDTRTELWNREVARIEAEMGLASQAEMGNEPSPPPAQ